MRDGFRSGRTEIEFVIAHGGGVITEGIVGLDNRGTFGQVGLQRALPHVTGIDEQHGAIAFPRFAKRGHVAGKRHDPAAIALRDEFTVDIAGTDDGDDDSVGRSLDDWRRTRGK